MAAKARINGLAISGTDTMRSLDSLFSVPNSPAASALNLNPDTMPRATLPKEFGLSNINGVDLKGNPQSGFALDVAPGQWFLLKDKPGTVTPTRPIRVQDYATSYALRLAMRTQLSFAEARGTSSSDKSLKVAAGIMIPLIVGHDIIQNAWVKDQNGKGATISSEQVKSLHGQDDEDIEPGFTIPVFGGLEKFLWQNSDLAIGGYSLAESENGRGSHFQYGGAAAYGTWDFSIKKEWPVLLVANITYRNHELVSPSTAGEASSGGSNGNQIPEDSLLMGGGIQFGNKTINATAFGAWIRIKDPNHQSEDATRYGVLAEYRLPDSFLGGNAAITISAGQEIGTGGRPTDSFVLGGVKIGLSGDEFSNPFGNR